MALLAAAAWLRWRASHPVRVTVLGALATVAIFFMHLLGLLFLAVLLGGEEFGRVVASSADHRGGVAPSAVPHGDGRHRLRAAIRAESDGAARSSR